MRSLQFSPSATADIDEIWDYTADRWSEDPTDVRIGLHKIRSGSHMIYYRTTEDRIDIIRILHAKQDVERHM